MTDFSAVYCHTCRKAHPKQEMRLINSNGRKHWRCIHSIRNVAQATPAEREAFGRQASEERKLKSQARLESNLVARKQSVDAR